MRGSPSPGWLEQDIARQMNVPCFGVLNLENVGCDPLKHHIRAGIIILIELSY